MSVKTAKQPANNNSKRLVIFRTAANGLPFAEGIAMCKNEGLVIPSNKRLGQALMFQEEYLAIKMGIPCWTATMTAYVSPDRTFKEETEKIRSLGNSRYIVYVDPQTKKRWLFPVPRKYLDKKNAILVAEKQDYVIYFDGNNSIVLPKKVELIEKFPASDGFFPADSKYDIPNEGESSSNHDVRCLLRVSARVGSVATDYGRFPFADRRRIHLDTLPSQPLGVVVEAP
jgi:hypothetical protein